MGFVLGGGHGEYYVADERLTLREAALHLGVSESAIRKRVERGTLRSDKGPDGRRYVYWTLGRMTCRTKGRKRPPPMSVTHSPRDGGGDER